MPMTPLWWLLCHPQVLELELQSPSSLTSAGLVSGMTFGEWNWMWVSIRLWVSRSRTRHPDSPPLTVGGTVLKEYDDLDILGVTGDSKMTFEKRLRSVSRVASQRLFILGICWRVFHNRSLLARCVLGFVMPVLEYCSAVWCSVPDTHLKLLGCVWV